MRGMYEYIANLHVHSVYSDGSGTIPEIAEAAAGAGIDIVGITDHRHLIALEKGEEGWYGRVLVIVGTESNDASHHYISFGVTERVPDNEADPQQVIDAVNGQGGIGFITHPFERGTPLVEGGKVYNWYDWTVTGYQGISIWDYGSQWRDSITSVPRAFYQAYVHPNAPVRGASPEAVARWDEECQKRPVVAIGGSDAHAFIVHYGPFRPVIFPYRFLFRCVNTHLLTECPLTGNLPADKAAVLSALRQGRCFVAFDYYRWARGFRFGANTRGGFVPMGSTLSWAGETVPLWAEVPFRAEMVLIRDGRPVAVQHGLRAEFTADGPGVYRLEAYRRHLGRRYAWIYSNPVYLS